jgi:hypothetical protein
MQRRCIDLPVALVVAAQTDDIEPTIRCGA